MAIPLWMPFTPVVTLTAVLWYRNRTASAAWRRRFRQRITPPHPERVRPWRVIWLTAVHFAFAVVAEYLWRGIESIYDWSVSYEVYTAVFGTLYLGSPLWGWLWAWLLTRYRNRLFHMQPGSHCDDCGYDLTGNVSGRCPECGTVAKTLAGAES